MNTEEKNERLLLRNLKDAGCNAEMIARFFELHNTGNRHEQLQLVFSHREDLLQKLHKSQNRLDCLDYLIYDIKKHK